ncbi:hypothetical protein [Streptomyces sp. PU-14G]|uniref:hypothetical protein n=1 Tax=Streptomyces sp. PU-14G TaxID=2800808 RepID=UPI0034DE9060
MPTAIARKSASLLFGLALLGGTAVTAGSAAAQPSGAAGTARAGAPATESASLAGWCRYSNWGGKFYCGSDMRYKLPNGHWQVFVIGTDRAAWTRWQSGSGLSKWTSLGGKCYKPGHGSIDMAWSNGWNFAITCIGGDGKRWYKQRYSSGKWSGWYK